MAERKTQDPRLEWIIQNLPLIIDFESTNEEETRETMRKNQEYYFVQESGHAGNSTTKLEYTIAPKLPDGRKIRSFRHDHQKDPTDEMEIEGLTVNGLKPNVEINYHDRKFFFMINDVYAKK